MYVFTTGVPNYNTDKNFGFVKKLHVVRLLVLLCTGPEYYLLTVGFPVSFPNKTEREKGREVETVKEKSQVVHQHSLFDVYTDTYVVRVHTQHTPNLRE